MEEDDKTTWLPVRGWWDWTGGTEIKEWLEKSVSPGWAWGGEVRQCRDGKLRRKIVFDNVADAAQAKMHWPF